MQQLQAIAYVSNATVEFTPGLLEALLVEARALNAEAAITGVLLFNDGNFMQYFEGPVAAVGETYQRVLASRRHRDVVELMHAPVQQRSFGTWDMGLARPSPSELLAISTARWERVVAMRSLAAEETPGLVLLKGFWNSVRR